VKPLLALALALMLAGCTSEARSETASLASALERYQKAELPQRAAAAADVKAVACGTAEVAEVKATCVSAIDATAKALALKHEVELGLDDLEQHRITKDDVRAKELPKKLDDAEQLLRDARAGMKECDAKVLALRMKHRV
jgi:hypothetical protein